MLGIPNQRLLYQFANPVIARFNWIRVLLKDPCVYCGAKSGTIDHIVPRAFGGVNHWENKAPCCPECNNSKALMPPMLFLLLKHNKAPLKPFRRLYHQLHEEGVKQRGLTNAVSGA